MEFLSIYECLKQEDLTLHFTLPRDVQTVIVLDRDLNLRKSDAIIHLIKSLGGCWRPLGWGMSLIPLGIRNYFYDKFAKNRYKICKPRY
jgi:predicted DCC family thiol-disulfide oxidoreductase YuxK